MNLKLNTYNIRIVVGSQWIDFIEVQFQLAWVPDESTKRLLYNQFGVCTNEYNIPYVESDVALNPHNAPST